MNIKKSSVNNKNIEIMAPVGSLPTLKTAIQAGADSVYFGINDFSMRSGKKNFRLCDIKKIKEEIGNGERDVKMYITLNTIVYDKELPRLKIILQGIKPFVAAVICSDFAVISLCKKYDIPFIVSTQCSVSNRIAVRFYKEMGAKRVVLARELSLKQIEEITKIKGIEFEVFAHGAMCVAVSGRCFLSQFLFDRSANRGNCLHPCRRTYTVSEKELGYSLDLKRSTIFSAKDLCTLPFINDLKKTGITALKIEGRNRDERYVDTVVRTYRKAVDENLSEEDIINMMKELEKVFNRGFSSGFYLGKPLPTSFASVENSAATTYRDYIGKVTHYYPKISVALISLSKELSVGDEIILIDSINGLQTITTKRIEVNYRNVIKAKKGDEVTIRCNQRVKKGAEVYKIIKKII